MPFSPARRAGPSPSLLKLKFEIHFIKFGSKLLLIAREKRGGVELRRLAANQVLSFTLPFEAKSHPRAPPSAPSLAGFAHFQRRGFHVQRAPVVNCTVQAEH